MSELEPKLSPENLFKYDYINEFIGIDMSLQMLKSGSIDLQFFKDRCSEALAKKEGKAVLKFGEKYGVSAPKGYENKIQETDSLADRINDWISNFLNDDASANVDELSDMIVQVFKIIKPPKKTK